MTEVIDLKQHFGEAEYLYALLTEKDGNEQVVCLATKPNPTEHDKMPVISLNLEDIEQCLFEFQPRFNNLGLKMYVAKYKRIKDY